jgi:hypothetical protein
MRDRRWIVIAVVSVMVLAAAGADLLLAQTPARPSQPLNTLRELFAALEACYIPPLSEHARPGMQITVNFSLNRAGEILGEPRFTFTTPGVSPEVRAAYQKAIAEAFKRCTPFPLTPAFAAAVPGKVLSMRFIDSRGQRQAGSLI